MKNKKIIKWLEAGIEDIAYNDKPWFNTMAKKILIELKKKTITQVDAIKLYRQAVEEGNYRWENKILEKLQDKMMESGKIEDD